MQLSVSIVAALCAAEAIVAVRPAAAAAVVEIAGEHRSRYESLDPQFRASLDPDDKILAHRTSVDVRVRWPRWTAGIEIMDSRGFLNDAGSFVNTGIVNSLEPIELNLSRRWNDGADSAETSLTVGRLTFDLGSRRLVARNRYRNTVNTFVGADWRRTTVGAATWRAFWLAPVDARPASRQALLDNEAKLDERNRQANLLGIYYGTPPAADGRRLETYALGLDDDSPTAPRSLTTLGLRVYRPARPGRFFYDVELISQTGRSTSGQPGQALRQLDHAAGYAHAEFGYRWGERRAVRLEPTLSLRLDRATGDSDPADGDNGRFDTLFGARRFDYGPTGIYGPFPRANLAARGVRFAFRPAARTRATLMYQRFRLASAQDAWPTTGLVAPGGDAGRSLGRQLDASVEFDVIADRLALELGAARFSPSTFVDATAPGQAGTSHYLYAVATVAF